MNQEYRKSRAIYDNAFTMYALIEEIYKRCSDPVFKSAARKMIREIKYQSGELDG